MSLLKEYKKIVKAGPQIKTTHGTPTLKEQQDYYNSLVKNGIARPDTYNIKPVSSFS